MSSTGSQPGSEWACECRHPELQARETSRSPHPGFSPDGAGAEGDGTLDPWFRGSPYADPRPEGGFAVLDGVAKFLLDSPRFIEAIKKTKSGPDLLKPMFCSLAGMPHRLALLAYCGVDVFDSIPLIMASETGRYLTATGPLDYSSLKHLPCACESCRSGTRGKEELLRHNIATAEAELKLVSHMISQGRLRELVETRVRADPWLVQNLRLMDMGAYELQEMHAPVKGTAFHAGSKESLLRPEIVRWQNRLKERYRRPEGASVLLLIPCSAKKPYSHSQSHMRFRDAIFSSGKAPLVHEVIVTSPLGLVPRELELFYPAQDYDIPVTGHWDRDEQKLAQDMVSWLVGTQRYDLVISHLGDERDAVASVLGEHMDTSGGDPGSRSSLDLLEQTLREHCPEPREARRRRQVVRGPAIHLQVPVRQRGGRTVRGGGFVRQVAVRQGRQRRVPARHADPGPRHGITYSGWRTGARALGRILCGDRGLQAEGEPVRRRRGGCQSRREDRGRCRRRA